MTPPKFSIITATYNAAAHIDNIELSLRNQVYKNFEWIIMDGGSTDETLLKIKKIQGIDILWRSEKDNGIYDAMNKAIPMCTGDYIIFMGADDVLADNMVLDDFSRVIKEKLIYFGSVIDGRGIKFNSYIGWKTLIINTVHHQSVFYKRELFNSFKYKCFAGVAADYELNLIAFVKKIPAVRIDRLVSVCGANGLSNSVDEAEIYRQMHLLRVPYVGKIMSLIFNMVALLNIKFKRFLNDR